eukprot:CAMPEP_0194263302 /NCGR_PEP_ID=MMETSP0158-20130606/46988_1 /TAXON_ID=33649 /ORGANISM="Thalassionema nitzschioides, Strain L26-B" /LENGTH=554 /DNA_ID=CAMNT_0039003483 /DNA_START=12 /DNA_END=1676 /DNA_ORIENTATION=-
MTPSPKENPKCSLLSSIGNVSGISLDNSDVSNEEDSSPSIIDSSDISIQSAQSQQEVREEFQSKARDFEYLLEEVTKMILDYYDECGRPTQTKICDSFGAPEDILRDLGPLTETAGTNEDCLRDIQVCFKHSLKTMHPFFLDKLYFGSDPIGQIAELISAVMNANTLVYHVSSVFSTMEVEVIQRFGEIFGFKKDSIEGIMNPGGTMSNTVALLLARNEHFPHVKTKGWQTKDRPVAFTAIQSHFSIRSAAMIVGMGNDNMVQVPADRTTSQMDPSALEQCVKDEIAKGNHPFFVNAVSGSTVMGAFDDLKAIAKICKRYNLWLHADACWGGFLIFASPEKQRNRFDGMGEVDSVSFNAHKGLGVPQQCSMLITNNKKGALIESNGIEAEYLYQNNKYDVGVKSLSCGRKGDALKLWLSIRKHGFDGFRQIADNELAKTEIMTKLVKASDDFEMVAEPMGTNVCYWYTPEYFMLYPEEYTSNRKARVHQLIFDRMKKYGTCLIQQNPLTEFSLPNFFRLALGADRTRFKDMEFLLEETRRLGRDITPSDIESIE